MSGHNNNGGHMSGHKKHTFAEADLAVLRSAGDLADLAGDFFSVLPEAGCLADLAGDFFSVLPVAGCLADLAGDFFSVLPVASGLADLAGDLDERLTLFLCCSAGLAGS
jgi:hypothetical protein